MEYKALEKRRRYHRAYYFKKARALDVFKGAPCMDCGRSFPPECMDYDHRPGVSKVANVSLLLRGSLERFRAEIAKCDLVCANCHRIRTKKRLLFGALRRSSKTVQLRQRATNYLHPCSIQGTRSSRGWRMTHDAAIACYQSADANPYPRLVTESLALRHKPQRNQLCLMSI
jgi:hypothetical protein